MSKQQKQTLKDLLVLNTVLDSLKGYTSSEFNYFIAKNLDTTRNELKAYFKVVEDVSKIIEPFNIEKQKLLEKHSNKDKFNEPKVTQLPGGALKFDITGNEQVYAVELAELKKKFATTISKYDSANKDSEKLLDKSSNIELLKIKRSDIPESVPTEIYKFLFPYIIE